MSNSLWPMGCSMLDSSVHGISQARIPEWIAISLSRVSSPHRDWNWVSCIAGGFLTNWATRESVGRRIYPNPEFKNFRSSTRATPAPTPLVHWQIWVVIFLSLSVLSLIFTLPEQQSFPYHTCPHWIKLWPTFLYLVTSAQALWELCSLMWWRWWFSH